MSQYFGLNETADNSQLWGMNFPSNYAAPVDQANNTQTGWNGLVPTGQTDFVTLAPLGCNRAFAFTSGLNIYGSAAVYSKAGAKITVRDQTIIDLAGKSGIPLAGRELGNLNNYVLVSSLPPYATPATPDTPTVIPPVYSTIVELNFQYLANSAYLALIS